MISRQIELLYIIIIESRYFTNPRLLTTIFLSSKSPCSYLLQQLRTFVEKTTCAVNMKFKTKVNCNLNERL